MVVSLRSRSEVRKQVQPSDLEFLIRAGSKSKSIQREAIEMLGILLSQEDHPEDVNRNVVSALINSGSKKARVLSEVLNALMDIYGDDDCHPVVFEGLNVLSFFQRSVPVLKTSIQCDRDEATQEEVSQWRETALNASRFIQYKKGQL